MDFKEKKWPTFSLENIPIRLNIQTSTLNCFLLLFCSFIERDVKTSTWNLSDAYELRSKKSIDNENSNKKNLEMKRECPDL